MGHGSHNGLPPESRPHRVSGAPELSSMEVGHEAVCGTNGCNTCETTSHLRPSDVVLVDRRGTSVPWRDLELPA
jgi:hypothetical protein